MNLCFRNLSLSSIKLLTKSFVQSRLSDQPARWLRNNLPFQEKRSSTYHGPPYPPAQCFANIRTMPVAIKQLFVMQHAAVQQINQHDILSGAHRHASFDGQQST